MILSLFNRLGNFQKARIPHKSHNLYAWSRNVDALRWHGQSHGSPRFLRARRKFTSGRTSWPVRVTNNHADSSTFRVFSLDVIRVQACGRFDETSLSRTQLSCFFLLKACERGHARWRTEKKFWRICLASSSVHNVQIFQVLHFFMKFDLLLLITKDRSFQCYWYRPQRDRDTYIPPFKVPSLLETYFTTILRSATFNHKTGIIEMLFYELIEPYFSRNGSIGESPIKNFLWNKCSAHLYAKMHTRVSVT